MTMKYKVLHSFLIKSPRSQITRNHKNYKRISMDCEKRASKPSCTYSYVTVHFKRILVVEMFAFSNYHNNAAGKMETTKISGCRKSSGGRIINSSALTFYS